MAAPIDALKSFSLLVDDLPSWIRQMDDLATDTASKLEHYRAEAAKLFEVKLPNARKNSSTNSIRPGHGDSPQSNQDELLEVPQPAPMDISARQLFNTARRKRKVATKSVCSGASGPQKIRIRDTMVVVYYDAAVQQAFESLVRKIGGARNNLRKGKMASVVKRGFQLPSLGGGQSYASPFTGNSFKNGARPNFSLDIKGPKPTAPEKEDSAFEKVDKDLDIAQNLCEAAAHQFLRDGDCSWEIQRTKSLLESALAAAKDEVVRLEEKERLEKETDDATGADEDEKPVTAKAELRQQLLPQKKKDLFNSTAIEVDDGSSASSVEIDFTAFRSTRATPSRIHGRA